MQKKSEIFMYFFQTLHSVFLVFSIFSYIYHWAAQSKNKDIDVKKKNPKNHFTYEQNSVPSLLIQGRSWDAAVCEYVIDVLSYIPYCKYVCFP